MVLGSWLCPSWSTKKMPEDCFLPAELRVRLSARLSAREGTFQGSIFSAGELTDAEKEGTSPEDKLGKCRASVHPIPLPKHSQLERSHFLQRWASCSPTCPGSLFPNTSPHCCRAPCQVLSHKHVPGRSPSPAQVSRSCPCSHRQPPHCPQASPCKAHTRNPAEDHWGAPTLPRRTAGLGFLTQFLLFGRLRMSLRLMTFFLWDLITEEEKQTCIFTNSCKSKIRHKEGPSRGLFTHCSGSDSGCYHMSRDMVRHRKIHSGYLWKAPSQAPHCSVPVAACQEPDDTKKSAYFHTGKFCNIFLRVAIPGIKGLRRYFDQGEMGFELSWRCKISWKQNSIHQCIPYSGSIKILFPIYLFIYLLHLLISEFWRPLPWWLNTWD